MVRFITLSGAKSFMQFTKAKNNDSGKDRKYYGKYFPVLKSEWKEPFPDLKIGENGRVHLHPSYANSLVSVYVVKEGRPGRVIEKCNIILLPKTDWDEVTQTKGKNAGDPLNVYPNGDLYAVHRAGAKIRVFVYDNEDSKKEISEVS
jgi:hypothetical protein